MLIARYTARFRLTLPLAGTRIRARNSAILRVMAQLRGLPRNTAAQARVSRNLAHLSTRVPITGVHMLVSRARTRTTSRGGARSGAGCPPSETSGAKVHVKHRHSIISF